MEWIGVSAAAAKQEMKAEDVEEEIQINYPITYCVCEEN